jgi:hypothetical protein
MNLVYDSAIFTSGEISDEADYRLRDITPNWLEEDIIGGG